MAKVAERTGWILQGRDRLLTHAVWFASTQSLWYRFRLISRTMRVIRTLLEFDEMQAPQQSALLRDIIYTPGKTNCYDNQYNSSTVVHLAKQMYDSHDFSAMPILADALQDAGCDNDEILNHCRRPADHVRGCWVVDLLLNLE